MERKEALNYITAKIKEGQTKNSVYKELLPKVPFKSDLLSYMAEIPDLEAMKQVKTLNVALLAALVILIILHSIEAVLIFQNAESIHIPWLVLGGWFYFILPLVLFFVVFQILKYRRTGYATFFLYAILMLAQITRDHGSLITWGYLYIPWIVSIVLTVLVLKKAFPYHRFFKRLDQNKLEADLQQ
ncbi:MAG: hypothetical protein WA946_10300 [Nitrospirota bacterium]